MNPAWVIQTGRMVLAPVGWRDLAELQALKADPRVYALMLGGVRSRAQTAADLADEQTYWASNGVGMWTAREAPGQPLLGLTGLHTRPDGRGHGLRFAFRPEVRGAGYAREAAGAALRFAHDRAGFARVVAVAREDNLSSRTVLGAIGMRIADRFERSGQPMLVYESLAMPPPADAWR